MLTQQASDKVSSLGKHAKPQSSEWSYVQLFFKYASLGGFFTLLTLLVLAEYGDDTREVEQAELVDISMPAGQKTSPTVGMGRRLLGEQLDEITQLPDLVIDAEEDFKFVIRADELFAQAVDFVTVQRADGTDTDLPEWLSLKTSFPATASGPTSISSQQYGDTLVLGLEDRFMLIDVADAQNYQMGEEIFYNISARRVTPPIFHDQLALVLLTSGGYFEFECYYNIYDLSDLANIRSISRIDIELPSFASCFASIIAIDGDRFFLMANGALETKVIDISQPAFPNELATTSAFRGFNPALIEGDLALGVLSGGSNYPQTFGYYNISDLNKLSSVKNITTLFGGIIPKLIEANTAYLLTYSPDGLERKLVTYNISLAAPIADSLLAEMDVSSSYQKLYQQGGSLTLVGAGSKASVELVRSTQVTELISLGNNMGTELGPFQWLMVNGELHAYTEMDGLFRVNFKDIEMFGFPGMARLGELNC